MICEKESLSRYELGSFGDERLKKNIALLHQGIVRHETVCLNRATDANRPRSRAVSRALRNPAVNLSQLKQNITQKVQSAARGIEHVLSIQDWSEMDYRSKLGKNHLKCLSVNGNIGAYQLHPMIVLDASTKDCLGIASINYHIRYETRTSKEEYKSLPVEEKNSYVWIKTAQEAKRNLLGAKQITVIGDREEDFYMAFVQIPDEKTHLLTRVHNDRYLADGETKLYEWMDALVIQGSYTLKLQARVKKENFKEVKKRQAREGKIKVSFAEVEIKKPKNCVDLGAPPSLKVWVINAKESPESVPEGEEPIHWRLITTHEVKTLEKAMEVLGWYTLRWEIEQFFRTLKKKGLDIESSQLEDEEALIKLAMIATQAVVSIMQLLKARDGNERRPASDIFSEEEIETLKAVEKKVEGRTLKQKNAFKKYTLSWASWIIARLGGWDVYCSSPAGPITMSRGLREFYSMFRGWLIAKDLVPD